jgi:hypothetical protein
VEEVRPQRRDDVRAFNDLRILYDVMDALCIVGFQNLLVEFGNHPRTTQPVMGRSESLNARYEPLTKLLPSG